MEEAGLPFPPKRDWQGVPTRIPGLLWQHRWWAPLQGWDPLLWTLWRVWLCPGSLFKGVLAPPSDFGILECVIVTVFLFEGKCFYNGCGMDQCSLSLFVYEVGTFGAICAGGWWVGRAMLWLFFLDKEDALESLGTLGDSGLDLSDLWTFPYQLLSCLSPFPCSWQSVRKRERADQELILAVYRFRKALTTVHRPRYDPVSDCAASQFLEILMTLSTAQE